MGTEEQNLSLEEAVAGVEFWTTSGNVALGTTSSSALGHYFEGDEYPWCAISDPNGRKFWAIRIPRQVKDGPFVRDNLAFKLIEQEIERRHQ